MSDPKPYKVRIIWGVCDKRTYDFATLAEYKAFMKGCEEAEGWNEFHVIKKPEDFPSFPGE